MSSYTSLVGADNFSVELTRQEYDDFIRASHSLLHAQHARPCLVAQKLAKGSCRKDLLQQQQERLRVTRGITSLPSGVMSGHASQAQVMTIGICHVLSLLPQ